MNKIIISAAAASLVFASCGTGSELDGYPDCSSLDVSPGSVAPDRNGECIDGDKIEMGVSLIFECDDGREMIIAQRFTAVDGVVVSPTLDMGDYFADDIDAACGDT